VHLRFPYAKFAVNIQVYLSRKSGWNYLSEFFNSCSKSYEEGNLWDFKLYFPDRRKEAMEKAEAALEDARQEHDNRAAAIDKDLAAMRRRADEEEERWRKVKERLETALRKANE
jgi:hypothetical protein